MLNKRVQCMSAFDQHVCRGPLFGLILRHLQAGL